MLKYFITDPVYSLDDIFEAIRKHKPDFVCYRNKKYFDKEEILKFLDFAKNYSKVFINYDVTKNKEILNQFDGIHFPTKCIKDLDNLREEFKNHIFITSTHSIKEVKEAYISDYITFSPIFNSKGRKGLGVEILKEIPHKNVIALGGIISDNEIKKLKYCVGFGSIRYFFNNL